MIDGQAKNSLKVQNKWLLWKKMIKKVMIWLTRCVALGVGAEGGGAAC